MKMSERLISVLNVLVLTLVAQGEEKQLISVNNLYRFDGPTALAVAPDEKSAAYARRLVKPATNMASVVVYAAMAAPDARILGMSVQFSCR